MGQPRLAVDGGDDDEDDDDDDDDDGSDLPPRANSASCSIREKSMKIVS